MAIIILDQDKTSTTVIQPSGQPEGTFTITQNGTYNISGYEYVKIAIED